MGRRGTFGDIPDILLRQKSPVSRRFLDTTTVVKEHLETPVSLSPAALRENHHFRAARAGECSPAVGLVTSFFDSRRKCAARNAIRFTPSAGTGRRLIIGRGAG